MPNFLVEETTIRDGGEGPALALGASTNRPVLLTLCISHVVERQNLDIDVLSSPDGVVWSAAPIARFLQKFCCGTYEIILPASGEARFLKAIWRVSRWGHGAERPLCRFYLSVQTRQAPELSRVMAGAA